MRARTARFAGVIGAATGACLLLTGTASAVPGDNGLNEVVTAAGSDTIQDFTNALFAQANGGEDNYVNVPPVLPAGGTFTVPADLYDGGTTYDTTSNPVPNGSSAGKNALNANASSGGALIDVARSSSGPSSSDPVEFEYYGFARDGVSWAASSTGAGAGVTLTLDQLKGIYNGSIDNWSEVGGADAPIAVYLPQTGSGTLSFFTGNVLGFDPTTTGVTIHRMQENDATTIAAGDAGTAIAPYSVAQWVAQANAVVTDKRAGFFEGTLTGADSDVAPVGVNATSGKWEPTFLPAFRGARTVYHVLDTRSLSYGAALNIVGFDASGPSPLCSGALNTLISDYGFQPLGTSGVTCTLS
ncbi:substrate-binding domain-containing protein [Amycolatopsis endophytica]|uniref:Phosphate transport system substrate-binding protein n=1 Tax=Amycolatopsis endophytica TaxID=860233 RepID=A0A853B5V9_9PSEU|nr:substrate-binding domain-containing protein [Amycolatopsis endophytica]NYI90121.1 phosphate transport system substrate-binding protein [Amycolatopsis endophytica]